MPLASPVVPLVNVIRHGSVASRSIAGAGSPVNSDSSGMVSTSPRGCAAEVHASRLSAGSERGDLRRRPGPAQGEVALCGIAERVCRPGDGVVRAESSAIGGAAVVGAIRKPSSYREQVVVDAQPLVGAD